MNVEKLQLPYKCFYIALPHCSHELWGGGSGWHQINGCYIWEVFDTKIIRVIIWGQENENSICRGDDAMFVFDLAPHTISQYRDYESYFNNYVINHPQMNFHLPATDEQRKDSLSSCSTILRIAINTIIYMVSYKAELETDKSNLDKRQRLKTKQQQYNPGQNKYKRLQKKIQDISEAHVTYINPSTEKLSCVPSKPSSPTKGHWVCGHWQKYYIGSGRSLRVRKWKDPYPRGDRDNFENCRIYVPSQKIKNHALSLTSKKTQDEKTGVFSSRKEEK